MMNARRKTKGGDFLEMERYNDEQGGGKHRDQRCNTQIAKNNLAGGMIK
jgi:hypothetical protein